MDERRNRQSDTEWLRETVRLHEGRLVRYATRLLGNVELARDVAQDAFLKLCRADRAELEGREAAWLFTVCRNRALDIRKKESRMKTLDDQSAERCTANEPEPGRLMERQESASRAVEILGGLPENQQEVIRLKIQEGLSYREISEVTGLSVSNVGFLLHKGIRRIREQFAH